MTSGFMAVWWRNVSAAIGYTSTGGSVSASFTMPESGKLKPKTHQELCYIMNK